MLGCALGLFAFNPFPYARQLFSGDIEKVWIVLYGFFIIFALLVFLFTETMMGLICFLTGVCTYIWKNKSGENN